MMHMLKIQWPERRSVGGLRHFRNGAIFSALGLLCVAAHANISPQVFEGDAATAPLAQLTASIKGKDVSTQAARQPYQVETAIGADCPTTQEDREDWIAKFAGMCQGHMPEHLAKVFLAIPAKIIHLSVQRRRELLAEGSILRAAPSQGKRADFLATLGQNSAFWIRSLEGPDPTVTVYMVYATYICTPPDFEQSDSINDVGCVAGAWGDLRMYRVKNGGPPQDVTRQLAPHHKALTAQEKKRILSYSYKIKEDKPNLAHISFDNMVLPFAPVLRWSMVILTEDPSLAEDPLLFDGNDLHFGFSVWDGKRFELKEKVPRSEWPCIPWPRWEEECKNRPLPDSYDPFITPE